MTETEAWSRAAEIAAALREGRDVSAEDEAFHARLFPPSAFPPDGLKSDGRLLWFSITGAVASGHTLDAKALHLLERACRCADEIALLDAQVDEDGPVVKGSRGQPTIHPAISEARLLRLVELRLLGQIDLGGDDEPETQARRKARHAAEARWNRVAATAAFKAARRTRPEAI